MQWISINLSILIALNSPSLSSFTNLQERGKLYLQTYSPNGNQRHVYTLWKASKIIKFGDNHMSIMMSQNTKMMSLISKCLPYRIHYVGFHKLFNESGQIQNLRMSELQCSSDISEPKYMCNSRQPNTHIDICTYTYAYTHMNIRTCAYTTYIRVCLTSMYEVTYCFFFC